MLIFVFENRSVTRESKHAILKIRLKYTQTKTNSVMLINTSARKKAERFTVKKWNFTIPDLEKIFISGL